MASALESDLWDIVDGDRKWLVDVNAGKTQLFLFEWSNNAGTIDVKIGASFTFSSKLDWGSYTISIGKTATKKIGALIRSMKFLSPEVDLYLYKSVIWPCMEYCCHVWADAPSCYLELLDKLQKRICRTVSLHLLPLWTIGSLLKCRSLYHRHYFGRSLSELAELAPLPYFQGRSTCYSDKVHNFSVTIPTIMFTIFWESDVLPNFPFTTSEMMHNYYL